MADKLNRLMRDFQWDRLDTDCRKRTGTDAMNAPMRHSRTMIRSVDLNDANECARLDAWIAAHPDGSPFHRPAWLKGVEAGTGQQALCLVAETRAGELQGMVPLHLVHSPLFGRALVSSGFAVGGGILATSPAAAKALGETVWNYAERHSCPTVELRGGCFQIRLDYQKQGARQFRPSSRRMMKPNCLPSRVNSAPRFAKGWRMRWKSSTRQQPARPRLALCGLRRKRAQSWNARLSKRTDARSDIGFW